MSDIQSATLAAHEILWSGCPSKLNESRFGLHSEMKSKRITCTVVNGEDGEFY